MQTSSQPLFDTQLETAAPANIDTLKGIEKGFGFVPNMFATLGRSEAVLQGYLALDGFFAKSSFNALERNLIFLAASQANECHYCVPAHSTVLKHSLHADAELVDRVKRYESTGDARLDAIIEYTRNLVNNRGHVNEEALSKFLAAGFEPVHALEIILGVALKTITNYTGHLGNVEVDPQFAPEA